MKTQAQTRYSLKTLRKLYDKILKTPSKKFSESSTFKIGGKMKADITKGDRKELPENLKKEMATSSKSPGGKKITSKEKEIIKKKKGGCVGPKYMCGGKKSKMQSGGLYNNINKRKKKGISRRPEDSTIDPKKYKEMKNKKGAFKTKNK